MQNKKLRMLIASALVVIMITPSLQVAAEELDKATKKESAETTVTIPVIQDEDIKKNDEGEITSKEEIGEESQKEDKETPKEESVVEKEENEGKNNETVVNQPENKLEENDEKKEKTSIEQGEKYNFKGVQVPYSNIGDEREEFKLKQEALKDAKRLQLKTDSEFEVALAHNDGSYSYLNEADTFEKAIEIAKNSKKEATSQPVVINKNGQVVYAENAMANIGADTEINKNIDMYSTDTAKSGYTYINVGYVDDAPIIDIKDKRAEVQVSGYRGWINNGTDIDVVPTNQVTNPSYYRVTDGLLYKFISSDLKASEKVGYPVLVGVAPSNLTPGEKYYSYDGEYFYKGNTVEATLNTIISDLRNNNNNNAINKDNPYYSYFNRLPFRSKTNYTETQIDNYISDKVSEKEKEKGKISKLRGIGKDLIEAQNKYGVNALLTLSVAINESGWGFSPISQEKNNIFGLDAVDSNVENADEFESVKDCINNFAKGWISSGYADPQDYRYKGGILGNKGIGANVKYASDPFWGEKAAQHALNLDLELSGNDINNLKDHNAYQLAIYTSNNEVREANKTLLYNIATDREKSSGYLDTSLIITKNDEIEGPNNTTWYEMIPERTTPVSSGEFVDEFNWDEKGYVRTAGIKLINQVKVGDVTPPENTIPNLNGIFDVKIKVGDKFDSMAGITAYDEEDGDLTSKIKVEGTVDTSKAGRYVLTYSVEDTQGAKKSYERIVTVEAVAIADGWHLIDGKYYFYEKGQLKKGWHLENGTRYYLDKTTGVMQTGVQEIDGVKYFFWNSGPMGKGWIELSNGEYYFAESSGALKSGWHLENGVHYYLDKESRKMQTGVQEIDGAKYYFWPSGARGKGWIKASNGEYYCADSKGVLRSGWYKEGTTWYYLNPQTNKMLTGWQNIDSKKYYFNLTGEMVTGWVKTVSGKYYYFRPSGEMAKGWEKVSGKWYYMMSDGIMKTGWLQEGKVWYYLEGWGPMVTGWKMISGTWYYFYGDGKMAANTVIDGWKIDSNGVATQL